MDVEDSLDNTFISQNDASTVTLQEDNTDSDGSTNTTIIPGDIDQKNQDQTGAYMIRRHNGKVNEADVERVMLNAGVGASVFIPGRGFIQTGRINTDTEIIQRASQQIHNLATYNNNNRIQATQTPVVSVEAVHIEAWVLSAEQPWYRDRKTLIILVAIIVAIFASVLVTMSLSSSSSSVDTNASTATDSILITSTSFPSQSPTTDILAAQYHALNNMFSSTNGPEWTRTDGWENSDENDISSVCMWYGVTCNPSFGVTGVALPMNNIVGDINDILKPLLKIGTLVLIDLKFNGLYGNMADASLQLAAVSLLEGIDLMYNGQNLITGHVTEELCEMHDLGRIGFIRVDCGVDCSCCDHLAMCECSDEQEWIDAEGNECAW